MHTSLLKQSACMDSTQWNGSVQVYHAECLERCWHSVTWDSLQGADGKTLTPPVKPEEVIRG